MQNILAALICVSNLLGPNLPKICLHKLPSIWNHAKRLNVLSEMIYIQVQCAVLSNMIAEVIAQNVTMAVWLVVNVMKHINLIDDN